ncbi:hypothetical protein B0H13DRAFT_2336293 [Mycena leptocephala]|nr:hypothetical protein B0H13DRAFT_2336293 [Mycena leptocephala]
MSASPTVVPQRRRDSVEIIDVDLKQPILDPRKEGALPVASSLRLQLDPVDIGLFGGDFVYVVLYLGRVDVVPLLLCPMLQDGSYPPSRLPVQYLISGTLYLGLFLCRVISSPLPTRTRTGPNSSLRYTWTYDDLDLGDSKTSHALQATELDAVADCVTGRESNRTQLGHPPLVLQRRQWQRRVNNVKLSLRISRRARSLSNTVFIDAGSSLANLLRPATLPLPSAASSIALAFASQYICGFAGDSCSSKAEAALWSRPQTSGSAAPQRYMLEFFCVSPVPQQTQEDAALELAAANFAIPSDPTAFTLLPFDINLPPSIHDAKHTRRKDRKQKSTGVSNFNFMVLHLLTDYSLDTLHTVGDEEEPDSTTVLLSKIHESQQKASLKRRYSPAKANAPFLVPQSPKQEMKRRKSIGNRDEDEYKVHSVEVPDAVNSGKPLRTAVGGGHTLALSATDVSETVALDFTRKEVVTEELEQKEEVKVWLLDVDGNDEEPVALGGADGNTAGSSTTNEDAAARMKQQKFIQTSIMGVPFDATAFPTFPELSSVLWDTVLGKPEKRDPLETYGDAAMHVVEEKDSEGGLPLIHSTSLNIFDQATLQPLLSNSTFLHFLKSRSFFTGNHLPKYPGNVFEIFAAALVKHKSLDALEEWIKAAFAPVITAAIDAAERFDREDTTANVSNPKADLLETHPREDDDDGYPAKKSKHFDFTVPEELPWRLADIPTSPATGNADYIVLFDPFAYITD